MYLIKSNSKEMYNVTENIYLNAVAYSFFSSSKNPEKKCMMVSTKCFICYIYIALF